jgi:hypothetical protein
VWYNHVGGDEMSERTVSPFSYIERFHRSLKEEEVWTAEYRSLEEAGVSIARWVEEYNHDRPHRGVQNRTPREAFLSFAVDLNETLAVPSPGGIRFECQTVQDLDQCPCNCRSVIGLAQKR